MAVRLSSPSPYAGSLLPRQHRDTDVTAHGKASELVSDERTHERISPMRHHFRSRRARENRPVGRTSGVPMSAPSQTTETPEQPSLRPAVTRTSGGRGEKPMGWPRFLAHY